MRKKRSVDALVDVLVDVSSDVLVHVLVDDVFAAALNEQAA